MNNNGTVTHSLNKSGIHHKAEELLKVMITTNNLNPNRILVKFGSMACGQMS